MQRFDFSYWKRVTTAGMFAGLTAGVGLAMILVFSRHDPFIGLNAGFVALCVNVAVTVLISVSIPAQQNGLEKQAYHVAASNMRQAG
ncbi:MAG TPA: hypothetical protein VGG46_08080 [Terriglobales bacterium]|jgi:Na+/proline symporter